MGETPAVTAASEETMKRDINIISSMVGAGLEREYLLLRELLMANGHYVVGMHYTNLSNTPMVRADINIFLEVVCPPALSLSRENWLVPNSEWWHAQNDVFLPRFTKILCKTQDCYRIWCQKVGPEKCVFTSFEARDINRPEIDRELRCLHVAGKSEHKNTDAVLRAWRMTGTHLPHLPPPASLIPPLTIVTRSPVFAEHFQPNTPFPHGNVTHLSHPTDEQIIELMNSHRIHVIPSMYEGFGHVIHEALGCGGLVVTTDAPPMNTYEGILGDCTVPVETKTPYRLAALNAVTPAAVYARVQRVTAMAQDPAICAEKSRAARAGFDSNRAFFRTKFMSLVNG